MRTAEAFPKMGTSQKHDRFTRPFRPFSTGRRFQPLALVVIVAALHHFAATFATAENGPAENSHRVSFNEDIRPIFRSHCVACHGGVKQASGLSFVTRKQAFAETESGVRVIEPGDPDASFLVERIMSDDEDYRMPPADHGPRLSDQEVDLIRRWIAQGADWEEYWAFTPPKPTDPPQLKRPQWCRTDIDRFILAKLEAADLKPSPEADRAAWFRRVSFDLTGLPPDSSQLSEFCSDTSPDAFEKVVDRLLASPAFGERWAAIWLDLARYADTVGYERDPPRDIWPYRDWVLRALNDDMPFDQFTIKQLAGDLLPDATIQDRLATAFHRNTQNNQEGGSDDEEYRIAALLDRVNTTWQVWQGLTFGCTQCHSHPYDPIQHDEYYHFAAFFNTSCDADVNEDWPKLAVPLAESDWSKAEQLDGRIHKARVALRQMLDPIALDGRQWTNVKFDSAESTGREKLRVVEQDGTAEVLVEGTITARTTHTLTTIVPAGVDKISAVRIDVLPKNPDQAERIPEAGFVLSKLELLVKQPGETDFRNIPLGDVLSDSDDPSIDPRKSLDDDGWGWAAHTRLFRPCHAIFILRKPISVSSETQFRLILRQKAVEGGEKGLVIQRARCSLSARDDWHEIAASHPYEKLRRELTGLTGRRDELAGIQVPVMVEQSPVQCRKTFVFQRGNWLDRGDAVLPNVPSNFPPLPADAPRNRLGLAEWLVAKENPLTARVMVNRLWEQLFGRGLVVTLEDFGSSGSEPTHPELLDYLALRFRDHYHWSIKQVLREIALSAVYRQSAVASQDLLKRDPQNLLVARGPRARLNAEMIRDSALAVSGLLSAKMYGPPVMPEQPEGVWRSAYNGSKWVTSEGEDRYRRAIYTYLKRTSGYPSFLIFDTPSREVCTARRITTNTPLQALVTLNDPVYFECAKALARRMTTEIEGNPSQRIAWAFQLATGHPPSSVALHELTKLYREARASGAENSNTVASLDHVDQNGGGSSTTLPVENSQFAYSVVANAILNLDEALTK